MKRTMFIVMSAVMITVAAPAMAKQAHPGPIVVMPRPRPPMPIVRQPVEPCPKSGCPIIKGPEIGTRGSK